MTGQVPPVPPTGAPARVAVPLPWSTKLTPAGRGPVSTREGTGTPVAVTRKVPAIPTVKVVAAAGVPARVAVPLWLSVKVTPVGSAPASARAGVGNATANTSKKEAMPTSKLAWSTLVIAGASSTVSAKVWVASPSTPLWAVTVK